MFLSTNLNISYFPHATEEQLNQHLLQTQFFGGFYYNNNGPTAADQIIEHIREEFSSYKSSFSGVEKIQISMDFFPSVIFDEIFSPFDNTFAWERYITKTGVNVIKITNNFQPLEFLLGPGYYRFSNYDNSIISELNPYKKIFIRKNSKGKFTITLHYCRFSRNGTMLNS